MNNEHNNQSGIYGLDWFYLACKCEVRENSIGLTKELSFIQLATERRES